MRKSYANGIQSALWDMACLSSVELILATLTVHNAAVWTMHRSPSNRWPMLAVLIRQQSHQHGSALSRACQLRRNANALSPLLMERGGPHTLLCCCAVARFG
ncbi:hypothetical protein MHYP_G00358450 [Metynnis hypsauchen]